MPVVMCSHCGSSLTAPDTQTAPLRCPVCGATLSEPSAADVSAAPAVQEAIVRDNEDDSATRAVAREQVAPLLTPVDADYHTAPSVTSATSAAPGVRWDGATQVSEPHFGADPHDITQALPESALPTAPTTPASALRTLSVVLVTLVLLAVVAVAALAANGMLSGLTGRATDGTPGEATVTPPAPTATPAFIPLTVANLYAIGHPFGWNTSQRNVAPQTYAALFSAPDGSASMNVDVQQNVNLADPAALDQQFIRALTAPNTPPATLSDATTSVIGGQRWTVRAADITLVTASGQAPLYAHVVARTVVHGDYAYTIVEVAPATSAAAATSAYNAANTAYFQPMLTTFTFLG